jgi:hypothetical protein
MDSRTRDLATVAQWRNARVRSVEEAAAGRLRDIVVAPSPEQGFVYVVKLLDVHPRLGKVSGRRLMAQLGIEPFARVSELTSDQVAALLRECGEAA